MRKQFTKFNYTESLSYIQPTTQDANRLMKVKVEA